MQCDTCKRKFASQESLKRHATRCHDSKNFICDLCRLSYVSLKSYVKHVMTSHPNVQNLLCSICEQMHPTKNFISYYKTCGKMKEKPNIFVCEVCKDSYSSVKHYVKHMSTHHPKVLELPCSLCQNHHPIITYVDSYKECVKKQGPTFECDQCGKMFRFKHQLKDHYNGNHSHEQKIECNECDFKTYNRHTFAGHIKIHKRLNGETVFCCHVCAKTFSSNLILQRHIKRIHDKIFDNIKCGGCNIVLETTRAYREHCNVFHSTDPKYECSHCGKRFSSPGRKAMHERIHQGLTTIPTIPCHLCGKEIVKRNMAAHIRTHTGEKPYKCKDCDYSCVSSNGLSLHRRKHRGNPQKV